MCDKCAVCKKEQPVSQTTSAVDTIDILMVDDSPALAPVPSPPVVD